MKDLSIADLIALESRIKQTMSKSLKHNKALHTMLIAVTTELQDRMDAVFGNDLAHHLF